MHPEIKAYVDNRIEELFFLLEEHYNIEVIRRPEIKIRTGKPIVFSINGKLYYILVEVPDGLNEFYFEVSGVQKMALNMHIENSELKDKDGSKFVMVWDREEGEYHYYIDKYLTTKSEVEELFLELFG